MGNDYAKGLMSNRTYDFLKYVAQIGLPALATLYFGLSEIWGLPYGREIVGTIVTINAFLGILLGLINVRYKNRGFKYDGTIDIYEDENKKQFMLNVDGDPYEFENREEVTFKINAEESDS